MEKIIFSVLLEQTENMAVRLSYLHYFYNGVSAA